MMKLTLFLLFLAAGSAQAMEVGDSFQVSRSAIICNQYPHTSPCFGCTKPPFSYNATLYVKASVEEISFFDSHFTAIGCTEILSRLGNDPINAVITRKELLPPTGPSETSVLEIELLLPNSIRVLGRAARHQAFF